jgi:hypothetical protein
MKLHPSEPQKIIDENGQPLYTDLGHRGDFDFTQIRQSLAMSPTERLNRHEGWRLFVKEALANARLRQKRPGKTGGSQS